MTTQPCLSEVTYDIRVTLADHTGSVSRCVIAGPVAERMLGMTVSHFHRSVQNNTMQQINTLYVAMVTLSFAKTLV